MSDATHIRLICWGDQHVQAFSADALRQSATAPVCTARKGDDICGAPIWAVDHGGEPRRYVGRPPHENWKAWAECIAPAVKSTANAQEDDS